MLTNLLFR